MKLSIVVLNPGPAEGKVIPINVPQFVIGRDPACQLRPASRQISKRHCALVRRKDKVFVLDFDSTNGTFVNDRQVNGGIELLSGDQLGVGPLTFAVQLETMPVNQPTPMPPTKGTTQKQVFDQAATPPAKEPARAVSKEDEAPAALLAMQDSDTRDAGPRRGPRRFHRLRSPHSYCGR
ncbi:MAG TPA: FHA domain-containing protein [Gemmataceae bacterium]|jgi:pSer/pThr/pTyr-binding forkhead associated (FHA) protein